jgi:hypothetical protein
MLALSTAASLNKIPSNLANMLLRNGRNLGIRTRNRNGSTIQQIARRNENRRRNRVGIEINRAEGGYKDITVPYRNQSIGINTYGRLAINKVGEQWLYAFQPENDNYANHQEYNIITMLNDSTEFKDRLKTTSQYRLKMISICVMNNRIPEARDTLSRLLLYVNTTKVSVIDPKVQNNVMRLNMNTIGTKNFNFNINNANIGKDFTGWFDGEDLYTGNVYLHVASEDINNMNDDTQSTIVLGTVKITFHIWTRIQDYMRTNQPTKKITLEEKMKQLEEEMNKMKIKEEEEKEKEEEEKKEDEKKIELEMEKVNDIEIGIKKKKIKKAY